MSKTLYSERRLPELSIRSIRSNRAQVIQPAVEWRIGITQVLR